MESKQLVICVRPDGSTKIEALGFNGMGCTEATAALEQALAGNGKVTRDLKPEASNFAVEDAPQQYQDY